MNSIALTLIASLLVALLVLLIAYLRSQRAIRECFARQEALLTQHAAQLHAHTEVDALKDEFISTVSHELRTPLTSIRGALGLLSGGLIGPIEPKAQNLLRIAVSNTDRLIRLINDILDLERIESGRVPPSFRRCSLVDIVHQCVETVGSQAEAVGIRIEGTPELAAQNLIFDGDGDRVQQVVTNILSNAVKFSPADTAIRISATTEPGFFTLTIRDQGRGIPAEKLETIFQRFQQVEASDSRQKGGSGLGLAISRSIVQQHGGSVWVTPNTDGPGVTFSVRMPLTQPGMQAAALPVVSGRGEGTVLVVDDDAGIRTIVAEQLGRHGYTVLQASRGEEALIVASEHALDAILLDLYMPGLSGWETLRRLKANPSTAAVPIVILSVLSPSHRPKLAGDAQGWVQKPFDPVLLLAELGRVLHVTGGSGHVLLVEDDPDLAAVILSCFAETNIRVVHAATTQAAMEHCSTRHPDLLLLDLTLPDGDGFSLVDWLRQQPQLRTLPLVVYSGREVTEEEMARLRLGPTQFLTKARVQPHDVEELVLAMVHGLRQHSDGALTR